MCTAVTMATAAALCGGGTGRGDARAVAWRVGVRGGAEADAGLRPEVGDVPVRVRAEGVAGDPPCAPMDLAMTWDDQISLGSVPLDCGTFGATGILTPPAAANAIGRHRFCIGNAAKGATVACVPYTVTPGPGECDRPASRRRRAPFRRTCRSSRTASRPAGRRRRLRHRDADTDRLHNPSSPPCADTPAPTEPPPPTATPTPDCGGGAANIANIGCATYTPTLVPTPTLPSTATPTAACDETGTPERTARVCTSSRAVDDSSNGGGGVHVRWTAVAVLAGAVVATGAAAAGGWWWWKRP